MQRDHINENYCTLHEYIYTSLDPAVPGAMCNKVLKILLKNKIKDK